MNGSIKKYAMLFDLHIGEEKVSNKGRFVTQPTHNTKAIKTTFQFLKDFKPDVLLLGGDQLNCGPVSHWLHGKPRLTEDFRLKKELDLCEELVLTPIDEVSNKGCRKIWMTGNHDAWCNDFVSTNPGIEGLIEPECYLQLRQRNYEIYSQGEIASIGKVYAVHGDVVLGKGSYANPARRLVDVYRRNIRAGHLHTYSAHVETTPVDRKDYHSGIIVPSLSTRTPAFVKFNPTNFINGFLYGYVRPDGNFSDYVAIINQGKCTIEGQTYGDTNR